MLNSVDNGTQWWPTQWVVAPAVLQDFQDRMEGDFLIQWLKWRLMMFYSTYDVSYLRNVVVRYLIEQDLQ